MNRPYSPLQRPASGLGYVQHDTARTRTWSDAIYPKPTFVIEASNGKGRQQIAETSARSALITSTAGDGADVIRMAHRMASRANLVEEGQIVSKPPPKVAFVYGRCARARATGARMVFHLVAGRMTTTPHFSPGERVLCVDASPPRLAPSIEPVVAGKTCIVRTIDTFQAARPTA